MEDYISLAINGNFYDIHGDHQYFLLKKKHVYKCIKNEKCIYETLKQRIEIINYYFNEI